MYNERIIQHRTETQSYIMTVDFNYMYDGKEYNAVANFIEGSPVQETHYSILLNRDELPILKERYFIDPLF